MLILTILLLYMFIAMAVGCTLYEPQNGHQLVNTHSQVKAVLLGIGWPILLAMGLTVIFLIIFLKALLDGMDWIQRKTGPNSRRR